MKKIEINLTDESYDEIMFVLNWFNFDNKIEGKHAYRLEEFIKGASLNQSCMIRSFLITPHDKVTKESKFRNRFKEIAKNKGIRQVDICNKLGIKKSNLSHIFNNDVQPRSELFFKIWALLGCPPIHECIYFED